MNNIKAGISGHFLLIPDTFFKLIYSLANNIKYDLESLKAALSKYMFFKRMIMFSIKILNVSKPNCKTTTPDRTRP